MQRSPSASEKTFLLADGFSLEPAWGLLSGLLRFVCRVCEEALLSRRADFSGGLPCTLAALAIKRATLVHRAQ
jgi:hypothetical protein